jgi:hypothetical protein
VAAIDRRIALPLALALCINVRADVLPEDRADALYHSYDGGGVEVTGPSILVRKGDGKAFSASANYYADSISSASIDVVTQGSPYSESRVQQSINVDYLHADTKMSAGYTNSDESDYQADTANFSIAQSLFGDLTTVTMGYARGWDEVSRNRDPGFGTKRIDRRNYRLGLSQILTRDLMMTLNYEAITDEGFLNNPYRSVRYLTSPTTTSTQLEVYPRTRTSNAVAAGFRYYLPYRAAVGLNYRYYTDDWDIEAHTAELNYTHPIDDRWTVELDYRYYVQSDAEFYSDLFPRVDAQNFMARDKELSEFQDHSLGLSLHYEFLDGGWHFINRATANLAYRHLWFTYDNFLDTSVNVAVPGTEPEYEFEADVLQAYVSIWY